MHFITVRNPSSWLKTVKCPTLLKSSISIENLKPVLLRPGEIQAFKDISSKYFSLSGNSLVISQQNYFPIVYNTTDSFDQRLAAMLQGSMMYSWSYKQKSVIYTHFTAALYQFFHGYTLQNGQ